jgi:hypothetical protein
MIRIGLRIFGWNCPDEIRLAFGLGTCSRLASRDTATKGTASATVTMAVHATLFEVNRDTSAGELVRRKVGGGAHEEFPLRGRPKSGRVGDGSSAAVALPGLLAERDPALACSDRGYGLSGERYFFKTS